MAIPSLTPEQLESARAAATKARRARADLKDQVRSGKLGLGAAIDTALADDVLAHMKVIDRHLRDVPEVAFQVFKFLWPDTSRPAAQGCRQKVQRVETLFCPCRS